MKKIFILAATATLLFSCKKSDNKAGTFSGAKQTIQHGKGWSWVKLDGEGKPEQLGLSIDDAAMNSMPVGTGGGAGEGHTHEAVVVLPLDAAAKAATPFDHIETDWNANGHEPDGIYTKPHFDFHFYMVPEGEVDAATNMEKLDASPGADYLPPMYVGGAPVPKMGKHYVDVTSPEFNGQPFTETFIYGSYDSKITFYEPMITLDFLKATTTFERAIPQPAKFKKAGYYPTRMRIQKHDGVTDVILSGFVQRQAS